MLVKPSAVIVETAGSCKSGAKLVNCYFVPLLVASVLSVVHLLEWRGRPLGREGKKDLSSDRR
jgi:hypothetical protein